jgi:regulatory protein
MTRGKASAERRREGGRRPSRPLDAARLEELALAYVARFATTAVRLERYLGRKLRERGWDDAHEPDLAALVGRLAALGYIDDAAFAQSRSRSLLRRGYGPRRVHHALGEAGIASEVREAVRPGEAAARHAALALARKRGFGPFGRDRPDRQQRERQLAAMLRAGHSLDSAREMVDAASEQAAEQWAAERDDEDC